MQTMPRAKHSGTWRDCVLVLAILGHDATAADILSFMRTEGQDVSRGMVTVALAELCKARKPLVERTVRGRFGGRAAPTLFRLTERGHAALAED